MLLHALHIVGFVLIAVFAAAYGSMLLLGWRRRFDWARLCGWAAAGLCLPLAAKHLVCAFLPRGLGPLDLLLAGAWLWVAWQLREKVLDLPEPR